VPPYFRVYNIREKGYGEVFIDRGTGGACGAGKRSRKII